MPIPDYQTIMLPLLEHLSDGKERSTQETIDALSSIFKLTEKEKKELLPSGNQTIFKNRIAWAKAYLKKAGLIVTPKRGFYKISPVGLEALSKKPNKIDNKFLSQYEGFREFLKQKATKDDKESIQEKNRTPLENLEDNYQKIKMK
jgi:restriction system protein